MILSIVISSYSSSQPASPFWAPPLATVGPRNERTNERSIDRSIDQSINQSINQSVSQSVNQSVTSWAFLEVTVQEEVKLIASFTHISSKSF